MISLLAEASFPVVFAVLMDATKRDLCPGLKWTLIHPPPSIVVDDAYKTHADGDLCPLSLAHSFTVTLLSFSEPA